MLEWGDFTYLVNQVEAVACSIPLILVHHRDIMHIWLQQGLKPFLQIGELAIQLPAFLNSTLYARKTLKGYKHILIAHQDHSLDKLHCAATPSSGE